MTSKIISREKISNFVDSMINDFIVIATTNKNNVPTLMEISSFEEVLFDTDLPMIPLKKLFHPAQQDLFKFSRTKGVTDIYMLKTIKDIETKVVVFGVRPCDITGNNVLDEIFKENFRDEYYLTLRDRTLIVGINCLKPCYENCFCKSMESNDPKSGYDLMFTEIAKDQYLVVPNTDGGKRIIELYSELFEDAKEEHYDKYIRKLELKDNNFKKDILVEGLASELEDKFESKAWRKYTKDCLFCGSCTFVCPTCYCYNVKDKIAIDLENGIRLREWDSCYYPEFARVAGGHDFRHEKERRFRYRYLHKYIDIPRRYNMEGCVGCGRCITYCPAEIDVREVLDDVRGES